MTITTRCFSSLFLTIFLCSCGPADSPPETAANDADGWQQYRHWINKAPAPRGRRAGIDPALYTWKGYRDWSEQVKRNWAKDRDQD